MSICICFLLFVLMLLFHALARVVNVILFHFLDDFYRWWYAYFSLRRRQCFFKIYSSQDVLLVCYDGAQGRREDSFAGGCNGLLHMPQQVWSLSVGSRDYPYFNNFSKNSGLVFHLPTDAFSAGVTPPQPSPIVTALMVLHGVVLIS